MGLTENTSSTSSLLCVVGQDISDAEEAFSVLGNRLRVQIMEVLADGSDRKPVSFTDLYEAIDSSNTSQFSYHLKELTGRYVQQTPAGYVISDAGRRIVQSAKAGEYTLQPEFDPVEVSTQCPYCAGTSAKATYDGRLATIHCLSCENSVLRYDLRPGHVADRDSFQALKAADRQLSAEVSSALDGVCQRCGGTTILKFLTGSEVAPVSVLVVSDCQQCGTRLSAPIEIALFHHREVGSRYRNDNALEPTAPTWDVLSMLSDWTVEVDESNVATVIIPENEHIRFSLRCDDRVHRLMTAVSWQRPSSR
ncbi:MAG: ArsR/SmtB family transcription factor [Halobacteriota archaeon]